jgi:hypothetical protein
MAALLLLFVTAAAAAARVQETTAPPAPDVSNIKTVHVVQACHLDIGFMDTVPNIIKFGCVFWRFAFPSH